MKTKEELHANVIRFLHDYQLLHDMTDHQMSDLLDLSDSQYKKLINGYTKNIDIYLIHRIYHLTGHMCFEVLGDLSDELSMLPAYLSLNPSGRRCVDACIRFESKINDAGPNIVRVYTPTQETSDGMIWDSFVLSTLNVDTAAYHDQIDVGIRLTNNDLHPAYLKDDILWICYRKLNPNDIGIFLHLPTRRGYIRKYICGFENGREYRDLVPLDQCFGKTFRVYCDDQEEMSRWIKYGAVLTHARI